MPESKHACFTEEHDMLRGTLREFMNKEVVPNGEDWDRESWLPPELMFVVDKEMPGFEVAREPDKAGLRTSDTAEPFFTDVRVPAGIVFGQGLYQIMANFQTERLLIVMGCKEQR